MAHAAGFPSPRVFQPKVPHSYFRQLLISVSGQMPHMDVVVLYGKVPLK